MKNELYSLYAAYMDNLLKTKGKADWKDTVEYFKDCEWYNYLKTDEMQTRHYWDLFSSPRNPLHWKDNTPPEIVEAFANSDALKFDTEWRKKYIIIT